VTGQTTEGARDRPGWDVPVELLVVLGPDTGVPGGPASPSVPPGSAPPPPSRPLTALDALRRYVPVTLDCPPRLGLVPLPPGEAGPIAEQPYVVGVYVEEAPPPAVMASLEPSERLFVDAWLLRVEDRLYRRKRRRGDGLPWDAPGYEPPDPPGPAAPH
jgi:hypothetical protein